MVYYSFIGSQGAFIVIRQLIVVCNTSWCMMDDRTKNASQQVWYVEYDRGNCWINEHGIFCKLKFIV